MNTKTKTGPLYKNVDELHEALVDYAKQALRGAVRAREPWHTESIGGDPVEILSETKLAVIFEQTAKERFAQIAQALWMERVIDSEESAKAKADLALAIAAFKAQKSKIEVDRIPLSSVEEAIYAASYARSCWDGSDASEAIRNAHSSVRTHRGACK